MTVDLEKREQKEVNTTAAEHITHSGPAYSPDVDIYLSDDEVVFAIDIPGVEKGNVDISIDETDTLTILAKNTHSPLEGAVMRQYRIGNYYRSFRISDEFDKDSVSAELENGLLQITIPKKESAKPRKIEITV